MFLARSARRLAFVVVAFWAVMATMHAWALNPSLAISQHGHRTWQDLDGQQGSILAIAQTTDGYMWLATANALLRFDGVRGTPWRDLSGTMVPSERVRALLGARDGALWIGTVGGLSRLKDGVLTAYSALRGKAVNDIEEAPDGTVWVGGTSWLDDSVNEQAFLCAVKNAVSECHGEDGSLGRAVVSLYRDNANTLWVAGTDRIWKWGPRPMVSYALPSPIVAVRTMTGTPEGEILVATQHDVVRIADGQLQTLPLPAWTRNLAFNRLIRDVDGAIWLGAADFGLLRLHGEDADTYATADGLSGNQVLDLFEDREGNVWVATTRGLDQFRPMAAAVYSSNKGLEGRARSVIAARDGAIWAVTTKAVYRIDQGHASKVRDGPLGSLFEDRRGRMWLYSWVEFGYFEQRRFISPPGVPPGIIDGIDEDAKGHIWMAHRDAGLLRLRPDGGVDRTPWASLRSGFRVATITVDPKDDSLWLGSWTGALMNVADGQVRSFIDLGESTDSPRVTQIRADSAGALWVSSGNGLSRVAGGRVARLDTDAGMPCNRVFETLADERWFWMRARCGVIRIPLAEVEVWSATADRTQTRQLLPKLGFKVFDQWDGVGANESFAVSGRLAQLRNAAPFMARSLDGRLWLKTGDGFAVIDPERVPRDSVPPPVHIEQIVSDGKRYEPRTGQRLPPLQRDLVIDYTGLSFAGPEKVQFRYMLEGRDADWQDAGQRRQAFYTDLAPGNYRFRVTAVNAYGVWNREGDTLAFSIAPAWWQTVPFRVACIAIVALLLYGIYRWRIGQISRRFGLSLETRVNERMRIARELHDTLLQTFQGLVLRLQTAHQLMPNSEGRRILEEGIDQAADAITEGRDAVQGLRSANSESGGDLVGAIRALGQVLATGPASSTARIGVEVHGRPRALHPVVRDDVFRIVGEALRNAFRHADPTQVEVEIRYGERELCVRVRDDGKGMDRTVTRRGREGHFGLQGMRERAELIGAKLAFWTRPGAGTAVELSVPAARAYAMDAVGGNGQVPATADAF